jgi:hypothetical protein
MITKLKGNLTKDYFKKYYQRNKSNILNRQKQYYYDNKDEILKYRRSIKDKIKIYQKEYHNKNINNPDYLKKRKAVHKRHYEKHKDEIAIKNRLYYENVTKHKKKLNKDYNKQYYKDYYNNNKEMIREKQKDYYQKNKERYVEIYKEKVKNGGKDIKLYTHNGFNKRNKWIKSNPKPSTYNFSEDNKIILSFS